MPAPEEIIMEELKPGAEIPTPAGIRFYPCENCIFYNCEVYLSPDIPDHEVKDIGTIAARAGLERRLRQLWDEIISIQDEIKFIDRNGFFQE